MHIVIPILSILILHILYIYTRTIRLWQRILFYIASITLTFGYIIYSISDYFTDAGVTLGVLYHVREGQIQEAGVLGAYTTLIVTTISALIAYIILCIITYIFHKKITDTSNIAPSILCIYISIIAIIHPLPYNLYTVFHTPKIDINYINTYVAPLLEGTLTTDPLNFDAYMPRALPTPIASSTKKNVLLIYLEGVEQTFSNESLFPNLTPNLRALSKNHTTFTNIHQIEPAAYTIGGMVASQCGLPLFSSTSNESHEGMKSSFLGGAICLGDILSSYGYTNIYIGGAESSFAGKNTFLRSHGYHTVLGRKELIHLHNLEESMLHNWGVYDDVLFDTYYDMFVELSEVGDPFMLTTLTLDTHPPLGYVSPACNIAQLPKQANSMLDAVACTDFLVGELIKKVQQSPYYENTTIVIISDHLAMRNPATPILNTQNRTNRILIIDNEYSRATYQSYGTTIDIGTTILPYIGFEGRIGLGTDLRNDRLAPIRKAITQLYTHWFFDVIALWNPPIFTEPIIVDTTLQEVRIQDQTFAIPSFINFTPEWESAITFRYARPEDTLLAYPGQMESFKTYLLIEECRLLDPNIKYSVTYCLGYGSNNTMETIEPLPEEGTTITKEEFIEKAMNTTNNLK